jgi:hypothetical protein
MSTELRKLLTVLLVLGLTGCANPAPGPDDAVGEWEKVDNLLPPINLLLSKTGDSIVARLRLSGVELHGTATIDDRKLRLSFPDRQDVTGEFTSRNELKLRVNNAGEEFVLKKRR